MLVARNRLGYEGDTAGEIRDDQRPVAGRPVFPGPQLALACPGPAWPQGAIYQRDRAPGSLCRLVHGRPELRGRLIDQWRQEANVSRDRGLIHVEDLCPDFLNDVIAGVSAGNDDCFTQGKFPRVAFSPVPRFLQQVAGQFLQFVELLSVQSWHTIEPQRPLLLVNGLFAFTVLLEGEVVCHDLTQRVASSR